MSGDGLRPAAKVYIAAQACLAVGLTLITLARATRPTGSDVLLAASLAGCVALAQRFPVHIASKTKLNGDAAATFAAVLLFEPAMAMLVAGGGTLLAHGLRRPPRDRTEAAFNSAQAVLEAAVGGWLLAGAGWDPARPSFERPGSLLVIAAVAGVLHLGNVLGVATIVALQEGLPLVDTWRRSLLEDDRIAVIAQLSLVAIGVLAAVVVDADPWALALLVAPCVAVIITLGQQARLRRAAEEARTGSDASLAEAQRIARVGSGERDLATGHQAWSGEAPRTLRFAPRALVRTDEAPDALVDGLRSAAHGGTWFSRPDGAVLTQPPRRSGAAGPALTDRERELLRLLARGWGNARIAEELCLGEQTVRNYLSRLYGKLGVQSRTEAIVWARDHDATS